MPKPSIRVAKFSHPLHPSTYPICGYQEEHPLTIQFPLSLTAELRYIIGSAALFRILGPSGDTDGSLLSW